MDSRGAQPRSIALILLAVACVLLAASLMEMSSALGAALGLLGLVLFSWAAGNGARLFVTLCLMTGPLLSISIGVDTRVLAVVPLLSILRDKSRSSSVRMSVGSTTWFLLLLSGFAAVSSAWSGAHAFAFQASMSLLLMAGATAVVSTRCSHEIVVKAVYWWSFALLSFGVIALMVGADFAVRGERVQGVMGNANGAGVVALLLLGTSQMMPKKTRLCGSTLAVVAVVLGASRASAISMTVLLIGVAMVQWRRSSSNAGAVTVLAILGAAVVLVMSQFEWSQQTGLFRLENSRDAVWEELLAQFRASPWVGVGWDNAAGGVESLPLKLVAEAGALGLIVLAAGVTVLVSRFRNLRPYGVPFALAVIADCFFEGWLLTGGSAYAWAVWMLAASASPDGRRRATQAKSAVGGSVIAVEPHGADPSETHGRARTIRLR